MTTHWIVEIFQMIKLPSKVSQTSYHKCVYEKWTINKLSPTYDEINQKFMTFWTTDAQWQIIPISPEAKESNIFEL